MSMLRWMRRLGQVRVIKRFRQDDAGATSVELALVAAPFLALLFAVLESALVFWANQVLGTAVADASRELYTGRFQQASVGVAAADLPARFKREVCQRIGGLIPCDAVRIDVRRSDAFPAGVPVPIVTDPDGTRRIDPGFGIYQEPRPAEVALVRVAVELPVLVPLMDAMQGNLSGNKRLLMSTAAFRTEQYQ
jgi:Flp pilus assembly pilin Flp